MKPPHHLRSIYVETYRSIVLRGATTPQKCLQVTIVWGMTIRLAKVFRHASQVTGVVVESDDFALLDDIVFREVAQKSVMGCARGVSGALPAVLVLLNLTVRQAGTAIWA